MTTEMKNPESVDARRRIARNPLPKGLPRLIVVVVVALVFGLWLSSRRPPEEHAQAISIGVGLLTLVVGWWLYWLLTGSLNPLNMVVGEDGRPSTSRMQSFLWTIVALFGYALVFSYNCLKTRDCGPLEGIPKNLFLAMGYSWATTIAAKGITVSYLAEGRISKTSVRSLQTAFLFTDDRRHPDLIKIQLLSWTVVAIGVFLANLFAIFTPGGEPKLPDIGTTLMVLMGLSNGTYLGMKLVSSDVPVLTAIVPAVVTAGTKTEIKILGTSFGDFGQVTFDDKPVSDVRSWSNDQILFDLTPEGHGVVQVGVVAAGVKSANTLLFNTQPK
jgi:hypothetical protein